MSLFGPSANAWCRVDSTLPVIAYARIRHYTRAPLESFQIEHVVRFFKAAP
jgi:hypothetical protein